MKEIDYLTEDEPIASQQFVCLSFLSPEGISNCTMRGIKIRGVYATEKEAAARAQYLQKIDPDFHIFVGQVGKWLPWDDVDKVDDEVYREDKLNNIMKNYKENQLKSKEMEEERKRELLNKTIKEQRDLKEQEDNTPPIYNPTQERLRKKLDKKTEDEIKKDKEEVDNLRSIVDESNKELTDLDDKIDKIKKLYQTVNS